MAMMVCGLEISGLSYCTALYFKAVLEIFLKLQCVKMWPVERFQMEMCYKSSEGIQDADDYFLKPKWLWDQVSEGVPLT